MKLIIAFLIVSVVPVLVSTAIATRLVTRTFEENLEGWLNETSRFFYGNLVDEQREIDEIAKLLLLEPEIGELATGRISSIPPSINRLLGALGYDLLVIEDDDGHKVFASQPVVDIIEAPLTASTPIYNLIVDGRRTMMAGAINTLVVEGRVYRLFLGLFIDENYLANIAALKSFEISLYLRQNGSFKNFYASRDHRGIPDVLDDQVVDALAASPGMEFVPTGHGTRSVGVYSPIFGVDGHLLAVVQSRLRTDVQIASLVTRPNVFLGILIVAALFAVGIAILLARRLAEPLRVLSGAVRAVSAGDFGQAVAVKGRDEVAELSQAFNAMTRELSRLRRVEARIRRRERLSTVREVAAGLAHEVRNPLGIIKTTAELLQRSPHLDSTEVRRLGYVVDEVRRIDGLIRDFLSLAATPRAMSPVNVTDVIRRVIEFSAEEAAARAQSIAMATGDTGAIVLGDAGQLHDAFLNLVLNAMHAMPGGGVLRIALACRSEEVHITFSDDGPGVPEAIAPRLFDPFVTSKANGTGLGLAKVFAVMESHGGRVEYRGGQTGAVFVLTLPLSTRSATEE